MNKDLAIFGVPTDFGQGKRGVDMGPSAIRYASLAEELTNLECQVTDFGNIEVNQPASYKGNERLKNLQQVVDVCNKLSDKLKIAVEQNKFPLVLGGDHSIAIGTLAGVGKYYKNLGVIWLDAHGDLNTPETTPSGNIHGMPLATSLGYGDESLVNIGGYAPKVKAENVVIIGARSLDEGEQQFIKEKGIKVYTMHEIDRMGMSQVITETIQYLSHCDGVHLSLDMDALNPSEAPGVGTPVEGGITYREAHLAMEMLAEADIITSLEVVEINPILDERNKTAVAAVHLVNSLFGKKIL